MIYLIIYLLFPDYFDKHILINFIDFFVIIIFNLISIKNRIILTFLLKN